MRQNDQIECEPKLRKTNGREFEIKLGEFQNHEFIMMKHTSLEWSSNRNLRVKKMKFNMGSWKSYELRSKFCEFRISQSNFRTKFTTSQSALHFPRVFTNDNEIFPPAQKTVQSLLSREKQSVSINTVWNNLSQ